MNITKERVEELREQMRVGRLLVRGDFQDVADFLSILNEKAEEDKPGPVILAEDERALKVLKDLQVLYGVAEEQFDEAVSHLRSRLSAPAQKTKVTRSLVVSILAEADGNNGITTERVERACVRLRDAGVRVVEQSGGEE